MKIKTVTLNNFRGFPGPVPQEFAFDGKNLLVYGENGAGKSSLFHALKTFFTLKHPSYTGESCNLFSGSAEHWIEVTFDDGASSVRWNGPPTSSDWTTDPRVTEAARVRGCLDYRDLLNTNFRHGDNEINLFDIAVSSLLADFEVSPLIGSVPTTIGKLWAEANEAKNNFLDIEPLRYRKREFSLVRETCDVFNDRFELARRVLKPEIDRLLRSLNNEGIELDNLIVSSVGYDRAEQDIVGMRLEPVISLLGQRISKPQNFLNEARLSALGLAIYLAGRLICAPSGDTYLKLLVLDDVLIGLDLSNRLPLLDLLQEQFSEWQIVLLTHDKTWFDMAEIRLEDTGDWHSIKMFEGASNGSFSVPVVVQENKTARQIALLKADNFLQINANQQGSEYQAAANYARSAFEATLKAFCDKRGVAVQYKLEARHLNSDDFLKAIEAWILEDHKRIFYAAVLERAKLFRRIILNPLSHADAPAVRFEVQGTIEAIKELDSVLWGKPPQDVKLLEDARSLAAKPSPTPIELQHALAKIRAKFAWSQRQFCERHRVEVPYRIAEYNVTELWDIVYSKGAVLFTGAHLGLETQINAERHWLVDEIADNQLQTLTQADIQRLLGLLNPNNDERTLFDTL